MNEIKFRSSKTRRESFKAWLTSEEGKAVLSILQSNANVDTRKSMGATNEMALLALSEYSTLLGRQQQVNLLHRLAEPPPAVSEPAALSLGQYDESLLPPKFYSTPQSTTA